MTTKIENSEAKVMGKKADSKIEGKFVKTATDDTLLAKIQELQAETLAHPQVVDKSERGVGSRVARQLNKAKQYQCRTHRYWTTDHVAAFLSNMGANPVGE